MESLFSEKDCMSAMDINQSLLKLSKHILLLNEITFDKQNIDNIATVQNIIAFLNIGMMIG